MVEQSEQIDSNQDGGDEILADESVFKNETDLLIDEFAMEFSVRNPQDQGGHIVYEVKGRDKLGQWECKRRYNEFHVLHEVLVKRFPSIPVPQVPPKKSIGNKDLVFIQERRYYLERFLRKLARFDFIIESQEFQLFARPQGMDVAKCLERLPKLTSSQQYDRLCQWTSINDTLYDVIQKEQFSNRITEFVFFFKKTEPFLKQLKNDLSSFLMTKQY